ncbi:MAG: ribonuclease HII [Erysipelotrichaceae bacterium]|nr:ribonuclease HII [Erysipelotrichaceae bacterium]
MNDLLQYENTYWSRNLHVIGIDEAGRGPLAGPLVVAGVVFPVGFHHPEINDSKQLSPQKRARLYDEIIDQALFFEIAVISPLEIDLLNIYQATKMAMTAIAKDLPGEVVLTDAMPITTAKECLAIIKGDTKSQSIAAASILAKVTRDRIMDEYDRDYPEYQFQKNKGYPTKTHVAALQEFGYTPIHRQSYEPVRISKRLKY